MCQHGVDLTGSQLRKIGENLNEEIEENLNVSFI
jgi:hypothetical protein